MADPTKKTANQDPQMIAPLLSTMPPPSQLPPKFFVPEATNTVSQSESTVDQQENQYQENVVPQTNHYQVNQQQQQQQYQQPSFTNQQMNPYQERN